MSGPSLLRPAQGTLPKFVKGSHSVWQYVLFWKETTGSLEYKSTLHEQLSIAEHAIVYAPL